MTLPQTARSLTLTFILLFSAAQSCGGVKDDWESAKSANTAQALATFIEKHPKSKYVQEAEAALRRARADFAMRANDVRALETFIQLYPQGADTDKAKDALTNLRMLQGAKDAESSAQRDAQNRSNSAPEKAIQSWMIWIVVLVILAVAALAFFRRSTKPSAQARASLERPSRSIGTWAATILVAAVVLWFVGLISLGIAAAVDNYLTPLPFDVTDKFKIALGFTFFAWIFILLPLAFFAGIVDVYNADKIDRPWDTSTWPMILYTLKRAINKHSAGRRLEIIFADESRLAVTVGILFLVAVGGGIYKVINR